jgi:hypothetical protein
VTCPADLGTTGGGSRAATLSRDRLTQSLGSRQQRQPGEWDPGEPASLRPQAAAVVIEIVVVHQHHRTGLRPELRSSIAHNRRHEMADERLCAVRSAPDHHRLGVTEALGEVCGDIGDAGGIGCRNLGSGAEFTIDQGNNRVHGSTRHRGLDAAVPAERHPVG